MRIVGGFGLLVIILAVIVAGAALLSRKHQSDLDAVEYHTSIADLIQDTEIEAATSATYVVGYLYTGEELLVPRISSALDKAEQSMVEAVALERTQGRDRVSELEELAVVGAELNSNTYTMIETAQADEREQALAAMQAQNVRYMQWLVGLTEVVESEQQQASALKSRAERTGDLAFWLLVISGAAGSAVGLVVSIVIARSILRPLSSLESTARAVARGDLTARADSGGPRELSHLGQTLNGMLATVQQRTDDLRSANEELRERNRQLLEARTQAATDGLTGLGNHRAFHLVVEEYVRKAQETGSRVGLVMLDIDGFKEINDSLGHLVGDEVLRRFARALIEAVGQDKAYRYGGDEFVVLLPETGVQEAVERAEELRRAVATSTDGNGDRITASLGVASFPDTAESAEELVYRADAAMYWAKSEGKNRVGEWHDLASAAASETKTERQRTEPPPRVTTARGG